MSNIHLPLPERKRAAILREAERAFRAGDVALALELYSVAGQLAADEYRRRVGPEALLRALHIDER